MKSFTKRVVSILVISTLAACGGGGGGGAPTSAQITTGVSNPVTPVNPVNPVTPVTPVTLLNAGIFIQPVTPTKVMASTAALAIPVKFTTAIKVSSAKNIPVFTPSTTTLTLPNVSLGNKTYGEVQLRHEGNGTFSLLNSPAINATSQISASSYSSETGVLTLKSMMVDDHRFTNVALHLEADGKFKLIEANDPILVQKTSYANAKNLNISSQDIPKLKGSNGFSEYFTGGLAFGDFFQDGNISMVGFSNRNPMSTSINNGPEQGNVYFYTKVNGVWVDKTNDLLSDKAGCISPRKVLVADFNGDGIPDVFVSCHGSEFGPSSSWTGEHPRVLLSQANGTYKNVKLELNCYCHGASAGDVNNDGTIDVVTSDGLASNGGKSTLMVLSNDGEGNFTTKHLDVAKEADVVVVNGATYYYSYFNIELIDFNNDGKLDLYLSGSELYENSYILLGDQSGSFGAVLKKFDRSTNDAHVTDTVFVNGTMYVHLYINGTKTVQVRKYAKDFSSYEVIYNNDGDDFVFFMPYGDNLVAYDSTYKFTIKQ